MAKSNKHSERVEFGTVLTGTNDEEPIDVCIGFTRTTAWGYENYGADADGNRGVWMNIIDEDSYAQVAVEWDDATGHDNDVIKYIFPADPLPAGVTIEMINAAIEAHMEAVAPTVPDEPEQDFDDRDEDE
jgi:hypothetical protein